MKALAVALVAAAAVSARLVLLARRRRSGRAGGRAEARTAARPAPTRARELFERLLGDVGLVAAREVRERTRGRMFRIGTVVILAAVAAAIVIPTLHSKAATTSTIGVVGSLPSPLEQDVVTAATALHESIRLAREPDVAAAERDLRSGRVALAIVDGRAVVTKDAVQPSDTSPGAALARAVASAVSLRLAFASAGITGRQAAALARAPTVQVTSLTRPTPAGAARTTSLYGLILLFILLQQYGAWTLMGVLEEKASRVVEVLLAAVRPVQLLAGKVLGIGLVALAQAGLVVVFALLLAKSVGSDLLKGTAPLALASELVWLLLGYAFYCWVYAAAGSMAERQDQLQSLTFPLSIPIVIGYVTGLVAASSGSASLLVKVLAYLPPTAPFSVPVLVALGAVTWWEFALSVLASVVATVATARFAAGIYRRAILRTGRRVALREVLSDASA